MASRPTTTPAAWRVTAAPRAPPRTGHALKIRKGLVAGRGGPSSGDGYTAAVSGAVWSVPAFSRINRRNPLKHGAFVVLYGMRGIRMDPNLVTAGSRPTVIADRREAHQLLEQARQSIMQPLREAVTGLPTQVRTVCEYHFGWINSRGRPDSGYSGKVVRPVLVLTAAEAAGGPASAALASAVAIELTHNFSLLHDDVMDVDRTRRNRETAWEVFGTSKAILAGDALLDLAFVVLAENYPPSASKLLAATVADMIEGQCADLTFEDRAEVTSAECLLMAERKSGVLMGASCALGAMAVGATEDRVEAFGAFGTQVGTAFQCVDDLLGIWGEEAVTGKPVRSDLARRKKSLPVTAALAADNPQAEALARLYHSPRPLTDSDLVVIAGLVDAAGGRAWTRAQADSLLAKSLQRLDEAQPEQPSGQRLAMLANTLVNRDR